MILNKYMVEQISLLGIFTVTLSVCFLKLPQICGRFAGGEGGDAHLTAFFAFFIFAGVLNCFNARTDSLDLFKGLLKNRAFTLIMATVTTIQIGFVYLGGSVLRTVPLTPHELVFTFLMALLVFPFDFIRKLIRRLSGQRDGY